MTYEGSLRTFADTKPPVEAVTEICKTCFSTNLKMLGHRAPPGYSGITKTV